MTSVLTLRIRLIVATCLWSVITLGTLSAQAGQPAEISGTITEAGSGQPVAGATVIVGRYGHRHTHAAMTQADAQGQYSVEVPVLDGTEFDVVVEAAGPNHAPGRYNATVPNNCYFNCGGAGGNITIDENDTLTGIDIELSPGGYFAGTITRTSDNEPLDGTIVMPLAAGDSPTQFSAHFWGLSDNSGDYQNPLALPAGTYHLIARPSHNDNYVAQAWQDYPCQLSTCPILDTESIDIEAGEVTGNLDFALVPGATLTGTVTPDDIRRVVRLWDGSGMQIGDYWFLDYDFPKAEFTFNGLAGGSYYLELGPMSNQQGKIRRLHNGKLCPYVGCDRATGQPLVVPPQSTRTLPEFALEKGGQISGTIIDAATGQSPEIYQFELIGIYNILDADGVVAGGGTIRRVGDDAVLEPSAALPDGDYYVRTYNEWFGVGVHQGGFYPARLIGYSDAMYPDVACAGLRCDLDQATMVTVVDGEVTDIVIEVETGSSISGSIVDDETDEPIPAALVRLLDVGGEILATASTDNEGDFELGAFPDGDYFLRTTMSGSRATGVHGPQHRYFDALHGAGEPCSENLCDPADGTAITLDGSDAGPFELRVESGPVISGKITAQPSGLQLNNGRVEVFDESGSFVGSYRINPQTGQYQTTALAPGDYTLVPIVSPAYSAVTTGDTTPRSKLGPLSSTGFIVTIGTEDVSADLPVIDMGIDRIFDDRLESPQ